MNLNKTQQEVLDLTSAALFSYPAKLPDDTNWHELYKELIEQAVFPLVYSIVQNHIPPKEEEEWSSTFDDSLAQNMRVDYEHTELNELMENSSIPYIILKGAASASYYPEPILRGMGDVDFLVDKENIDKAGLALESAGFEKKENLEHDSHVVYHRPPDSVWELHWQMAGIPQSVEGDSVRAVFDDLIKTGHMKGSCIMPDDFHHGIILLVHTAVHLTNTGIGLRHLCDWAVFVNSVNNFEQTFKETLQKCGLWRFAQILTQVCEEYLHMPEQPWANEDIDKKLLSSIIYDIFAGGNFGSKDSERINQAKLMINTKTGRIDGKSMYGKLFTVMNIKAKMALPICGQHRIFLPIGWIYVFFRHLSRIAHGTRPKIHIDKMIEGAQQRREIYKQFHLYEGE